MFSVEQVLSALLFQNPGVQARPLLPQIQKSCPFMCKFICNPESLSYRVSPCPRQAMSHPLRPPGPDLLGPGGIISSFPGLETGHFVLTTSFTCPAYWLLAHQHPSCSEGLDPPLHSLVDLMPAVWTPQEEGPSQGLASLLFSSSERESSIPM